PALDQEAIQCEEALGAGPARSRNAEVLEHVFQQAIERHRGVEDERDIGVRPDALHERAEQRGLARTHLAREDDEALALLYAVDELRQRLAVARRQEEKLRVGRRAEWLLAKAVEVEVHAAHS